MPYHETKFPSPKAVAALLTAFAVFTILVYASWQAENARQVRLPTLAGMAGHEEPRSTKWPTVRKHFLEKHPTCAACGRDAKQSGQPMEVHHKVPFHDDEAKELDEDNLIALCRRCHELIGHLDKWSSYNPDVKEDAERMLKKIENRP